MKWFLIFFIISSFHQIYAQNEVIKKIAIERLDVFDTLNANWIEKIGNKLHTKTKEQIIRRELLFNEGDTLNIQLVDETARNLRKLGFLATADVKKKRDNDSLVDINVVTRDRWSLYAMPWYINNGGITNASLSAGENNFRGLGQGLNLSCNYISTRKSPLGGEIDFSEPRTFGSEISTSLVYKNSEDLKQTAVSFVKPFYTEEETWSAGIYADGGTVKAVQYANGILQVEQFFNFQSQNIWGIYSFNSGADKMRFGSAFIRERYGYDSLFNSIAQQITLINFSMGWMNRRFIKETYFDCLGRIEDVSEGLSSSLVFGMDIVKPKLYYFLFQTQFVEEFLGAYFSGEADIHGYDEDLNLKDATVSFNITSASKTGSRSSFEACAADIYGINWSNGQQMYLDSPNRLRGIPSFTLTGNRRLTLNIEERFDNDINWRFFKIGSALFADGGMIWSQGEEYTSAKFYKSFGYGIRIQNERLLGETIVRLDFAYNIDRNNFEFIISTNQLFSAFGGVDTASPSSF